MNTSYQGTKEAPHLLAWLKTYPYPHCRSANSLSSLRSGVALAEILTDKLPKAYHHLFIPNIEIYNITPQRSIMNLKVMLDTLQSLCSEHPEIGPFLNDFTAEGLYFDHNMMEEFIISVIKPLDGFVPSEEQRKEIPQGVEELSEIANLSSIMVPIPEKIIEIVNKKETEKKEEADVEEMRISKICRWLQESHHLDVQDLTPEEIMGELVNSVFAGSRLDRQKVIKKSHYEQGASCVFKKIGEYLLGCERMPKQNVLALLDEIDTGYMRQQLFWNVIEDIMNLKVSHNLKMSRKKSIRKTIEQIKTQGDIDKENIVGNQANLIPQQQMLKKSVVEVYQCSTQILQLSQNWIRNELGYEHSLMKSKTTTKLLQNPLLNGILLGSIIMRMQLGKVNINKEPKNKAEVQKNMNEVSSCIIRRGLDSGRKLSKYRPSYKTYLGIIWQVKVEMQKKIALEKNRRAEQAREKKQLIKSLSQTDKDHITEWIKSRGYEFQELTMIPSILVSEICGDILELRLLRETTKKIRENNMTKIVDQLRRLGWEGEGGSSDALSYDGDEMRWSMLRFAYELVKFKVYYCR